MEMARKPLVQQRAREHIEEVLERHNGQMSYQALQEMTYLDWILQGNKRARCNFCNNQSKNENNLYRHRGTQDVSTCGKFDESVHK